MNPWNLGPIEFEATGGEVTVVELRVPHRGEISTVLLNQIGGTQVGGTFRILNSQRAAQSLDGSSESSAMEGVDPDASSIMGVKTITSGKYEEFPTAGGRYPYRNADGNYTNPVRKLWLVIEPGGTGSKTWSLAMTIIPTMS